MGEPGSVKVENMRNTFYLKRARAAKRLTEMRIAKHNRRVESGERDFESSIYPYEVIQRPYKK